MRKSYVVLIGDTPTHTASSLDSAQNAALTAHFQYLPAENYDTRWDEYQPGEVWRLMSRHKDRKGRHSWTGRAVHAVEVIEEGSFR
ncbi:hypothetical protein GCM10010275_19570 [Streptomyces litmocidini]|uniref:hypothetical protein n=1 Tax=Streptomyces litmocidini TaxID=67318 RepID=UPI00167CD5EE|nr:hypothetical protein [Streptomyces litmocidini]GGU84596.1 hypothetical protein GCM10010275_19570 [Streptomyces litmocidini]